MRKKNKGAQEGRPAAPEDESCVTDSMIWNAKSLQRVVKKLERNGPEHPQQDLLHIKGRALAVPIFLSLPRELALKALLCLERKKDPFRIHDLLKLFEQLEPDTQELLRAEMPGWTEIIKASPFHYGSCLRFCGLTEMLTHTGDFSTKDNGVCFEPVNSTRH